MKFISSSGAMLSALVLTASMSAHGQSVLLTGDAQINSAATSTNYGASTSLAVNSTNSVLLQFDLVDILPAGTTSDQVTRARLVLFPDKVTTAGNVNVYGVTGSWDESTLTYAAQPTVSTSSAGSGAAKAAFRPIYIAVTGLVQNWLTSSSSNHGFEVKASGTTSFTLDSKENTATSHQAVLQIDLIGPAGATGATGPAGAKGATGATGPAGGISLPYLGQSYTASGPVFEIDNQAKSGGIAVTASGGDAPDTGANGGIGLYGKGGLGSANVGQTTGGAGVYGEGGTALRGDAFFPQEYGGYGGDGGYFQGGYARAGSKAGYGVEAFGGAADSNAIPGVGLYATYGEGVGNITAAQFSGDVSVSGNLSKSSGSFKIDHPLDPANKYLSHSFVESPDMMNIYNGNVTTDGSGTAVVTMPDWFEALNRDFRYQLTVIGQPAMAYVGTELLNRSFTIKTDRGDVKVSWQVTGIRQDAWANAHRIPIEEEKSAKEKGHYTHPELFGHAGEPSVMEMEHPRPKRSKL